jgi:Leucine-rich repeat (LRR) protein
MALFLFVNAPSGPIPPELGRLPQLTYLGLGRNKLSGEIPKELGSLTKLKKLSLMGNELSGANPLYHACDLAREL